MSEQMTLLTECLITYTTGVVLLSTMYVLVVEQMALKTERRFYVHHRIMASPYYVCADV